MYTFKHHMQDKTIRVKKWSCAVMHAGGTAHDTDPCSAAGKAHFPFPWLRLGRIFRMSAWQCRLAG